MKRNEKRKYLDLAVVNKEETSVKKNRSQYKFVVG